MSGVDLSIETHEFVAIWGPSGSGKSTLCNLVGAIDTPTDGRVSVGGRDIAGMTEAERADHRNRTIGFVFQQFNLLPVLTALENVALPLVLRGESPRSASDRAAARLEEMGLGAFVRQRPDKLSGGQRQRVAIARALVGDPRIVIADEPTANLDSENAERIVELMRQFSRRLGTTFLFATHDQRLLDRVHRRIHLRDGRIVDDEAGNGS